MTTSGDDGTPCWSRSPDDYVLRRFCRNLDEHDLDAGTDDDEVDTFESLPPRKRATQRYSR